MICVVILKIIVMSWLTLPVMVLVTSEMNATKTLMSTFVSSRICHPSLHGWCHLWRHWQLYSSSKPLKRSLVTQKMISSGDIIFEVTIHDVRYYVTDDIIYDFIDQIILKSQLTSSVRSLMRVTDKITCNIIMKSFLASPIMLTVTP